GEFGRPPELRAYKLGFDDLEAIKAEIIHRRDQLSRALDTGDPVGLLRCTWYGRCEYESICGCAEAAELGRIVPAASVRIERDARLENLFAGKLGNDNSKVSGFRFFLERKRLAIDRPWNVDTLAFQCALAGIEKGRLVLYYEALPDDKFMVYEMMFNDLPAIRAEVGRRLSLLESGAPPSELPACPAWMAKTCPYRDRCGCGDAA